MAQILIINHDKQARLGLRWILECEGFANEFLPIEAECLNFINADLIAQGLSPFQPNKMAIRQVG